MASITLSTKINHPESTLKELKNLDGLPFSKILSTECVDENIRELKYRNRCYTPDIIIWSFLSQVLSEDQSCQAAVARIIAFFISQGNEPPSANTAAYSKARTRLPEEIISNITKDSAKKLEDKIPSKWLWHNKKIKLIDGSTVFMPDTKANQATYPQMKSQKPGLGFPIARIVAVISYATGAVFDVAISPYSGKGSGEHALLRQILNVFKPGDVALGDAYYASYFLIAKLIEIGVDIVFPIHGGRHHDFRTGIRIGKKDHIVRWKKPQRPQWMSIEEYILVPGEITLREASIQNTRKGFKVKARTIVTTFLDSTKITKNDLKVIYDYRWSVETDLKSIKNTMKMDVLRGKTPEMIRKEIWMHILAYNLIRKIMMQTAVAHNKTPRGLSFKLALQMVTAFRQGGILADKNGVPCAHLLKAIAYKIVGNRPGRCEPRRIKHRPKSYGLLVKPRSDYHQMAA